MEFEWEELGLSASLLNVEPYKWHLSGNGTQKLKHKVSLGFWRSFHFLEF